MNRSITWLWGRLPLGTRQRAFIIWLLSPKYTVGVVGLVRDSEGRILVLKHTYRPASPWGLPGGGLRKGETLEECLRREVWEEACIKVEVGTLLSATSHPRYKLVDMVFECRPLPGENLSQFQQNAEVTEARFVEPDRLPKGMPAGQRRMLQIALAQAEAHPQFQFQSVEGDWP